MELELRRQDVARGIIQNVITVTPPAVERSFSAHGAAVSRSSTAPEVCYPAGCATTFAWGQDKPIYFKPVSRHDFVVVLFKQQADAARTARLEATHGLGAERRGNVLLLFYKLSPRLAKLRAALAGTR